MARRKDRLDFARVAELLASIDEHQEALERLMKARGVEIESPYSPQIGSCWEIEGCRDSGTIAVTSVKNSAIPASRSAAFINQGYPPALQSVRKCENPFCVRPEHHYWLKVPTNQEQAALERDSLTAFDVREIVRRARTGESSREELAKEYGLTPEKVGRIVCGDTYAGTSAELLFLPDQSKYSSMSGINHLDILVGMGLRTVNKIPADATNEVLSELGRKYGANTFRLRVGGKDLRALEDRLYSYRDISAIFALMREVSDSISEKPIARRSKERRKS